VRVLSQELGISRAPVREALADLAREGMVALERGRGVRINDTRGHDILEIFQLRRMIEIAALREAVPRFATADIRALGRELGGMRSHLEDELMFTRHDAAFHRVPLEVLGNARTIATVSALREEMVARNLFTVGRTRKARAIVAEHQAIYEAVRQGRAERAAQAMERHLLITEELMSAQFAVAAPSAA
jgi:DNA-binding GntR family transcriptional regulator